MNMREHVVGPTWYKRIKDAIFPATPDSVPKATIETIVSCDSLILVDSNYLGYLIAANAEKLAPLLARIMVEGKDNEIPSSISEVMIDAIEEGNSCGKYVDTDQLTNSQGTPLSRGQLL